MVCECVCCGLQVLVLQSLHTTGSCLQHLALNLPALQRLQLHGELMLGWAAISSLQQASRTQQRVTGSTATHVCSVHQASAAVHAYADMAWWWVSE